MPLRRNAQETLATSGEICSDIGVSKTTEVRIAGPLVCGHAVALTNLAPRPQLWAE